MTEKKRKDDRSALVMIKKIFRPKRIILALITLGILVAIYQIVTTALRPLPVTTVRAKLSDIQDTVAVSGFIKAANQADLGFAATTSKVVAISVKVGDTVTAGQSLASVDASALYNQYLAAQAAFEGARNTYLATRASETSVIETYKDPADLASEKIKALLNQAHLSSRAADDAQTRAEAALNESKTNLSKSAIVAPTSGTVTQVNGQVGEIPSGTFIQITDLNSIYYDTLVDELDIGKIKLGQIVDITLDASKNTSLSGVIESLSPVAVKDSTNNTTIEVKVNILDNKSVILRPGMQGDAIIVISDHKNVLTVPFEAVIDQGGKKYVWVVTNGIAKRMEVTTGIEGESDTEVTSGIKVDAVIITSPQAGLKEGQKVVSK